MNRIYYFSGSGKSRRLAEYFGQKLSFPVLDITQKLSPEELSSETAVVVFPVYCQNLPDPLLVFLPKLKAENIAFIALYGKKSFGNVIFDAAKLTNAVIIAGACVPCGHSFLSEPDNFDFSTLEPIIQRIKSPSPAKLAKERKDFYADLVPAKRTQLCVKISRSSSCIHCGTCIKNCPMHTMTENSIGKNCIRCLRCVNDCPKKALSFKTSAFLKLYLTRNCKNEFKIYL